MRGSQYLRHTAGVSKSTKLWGNGFTKKEKGSRKENMEGGIYEGRSEGEEKERVRGNEKKQKSRGSPLL